MLASGDVTPRDLAIGPYQEVRRCRNVGAGVSPDMTHSIRRDHLQLRIGQDRELQAIPLRHLARGKTNKEIGSLLGISARTVQNHVAHVYDKAGVYSRAGAALFATENNLLD